MAKKKSATADTANEGLIQRIAQLRAQRFGKRGKASFAKALGISPSTYNYYEKDRVPPCWLLVRMAQVTGADLKWLLTGQGQGPAGSGAGGPLSPAAGEPYKYRPVEVEPGGPGGAAGGRLGQQDRAILERLARLLGERPGAGAALSAFLDLLEEKSRLEASRQGLAGQELVGQRGDWIPVLGRTAAGVPHFWAELGQDQLRQQYDQAIVGLAGRAAQRSEASGQAVEGAGSQAEPVQLIQVSEPVELYGLSVSEFLQAPAVLQRWPDAFALRVDGESMSPAIRHGDVVVLSPGIWARDGAAAVVQLRNQIGVTCKLFRRDRNLVHLIPVNEAFRPTVHTADELVWALAVLLRVRPGG